MCCLCLQPVYEYSDLSIIESVSFAQLSLCYLPVHITVVSKQASALLGSHTTCALDPFSEACKHSHMHPIYIYKRFI